MPGECSMNIVIIIISTVRGTSGHSGMVALILQPKLWNCKSSLLPRLLTVHKPGSKLSVQHLPSQHSPNLLTLLESLL